MARLGPPSWTRREWVALALCCALSLLVHAAFVLPYFGEPDAARIALDALRWLHTGKLDERFSHYRGHTSPLYIHALRLSIEAGLQPVALPRVINYANVFFGTAAICALYLLFRRLVSTGVAALACVLYSCAPVFFVANIYGMSHTPALAFFSTALALFAAAFDTPRSRPALAVLIALSMASMTAAVCLKADIALAGAALIGLLVVFRRLKLAPFSAAAAIMAVAALTKIGYSRVLLDAASGGPVFRGSSNAFVEILVRWNTVFPFDSAALLDPKEISAFTHASGPFLHSVWLFAMLALPFVAPQSRRLWCFAVLWAFPLWLFWASKPGNSARHNIAVLPPVLLMASYFLWHIAADRARVALLAAAVLSVNYFSAPRGRKSIIPQSRIVQLAEELERDSRSRLESARYFADMPQAKKAVVTGNTLPYVRYLVMARAVRVKFQKRVGHMRLLDSEGHWQEMRSRYALRERQALPLADKWSAEGFVVWSPEYRRARRQ